jgi:hypothetical protein
MSSTYAGLGPQINTSTWTFDGSEWVNVQASLAIPSTLAGSLVYDSDRKRELFITTTFVSPTETWEWDGVTWRLSTTKHSPDGMNQDATAAYSPELHATVLVDPSVTGAVQPPPTWLYDGTDWRPIFTAHLPGPNAWARIAYDPIRRAIVALSLDDFRTWIFDGADWTPLPIQGVTPEYRGSPAIGFDPERGVWVLFGGNGPTTVSQPVLFSDTWTSDGNTWTEHTLSPGPAARGDLSFFPSDPASHRLLLFGGWRRGSVDEFLGDTWAWDGSRWTQLAGPVYANLSGPPASGARLSSPGP